VAHRQYASIVFIGLPGFVDKIVVFAGPGGETGGRDDGSVALKSSPSYAHR